MAIYRFNFSKEFTKKANAFSDIHKNDSIEDFKLNLNKWMETNREVIMMEMRLLENKGYKKDIYEKIFKTIRYYLKNKTKKEIKKRRKYINLSREFLNIIDNHIEKCIDMKPSIAYDLFEKLESDKIKQEKQSLFKYISNDECSKKIKKTYKNRMYYKKNSDCKF